MSLKRHVFVSMSFLAILLAFAALFSECKKDETSLLAVKKINENCTNAFVYKLKHYIKIGENVNSKWGYCFAAHLKYSYRSYNILCRTRLLGFRNFNTKQNFSDNVLTIHELEGMFQNDIFS